MALMFWSVDFLTRIQSIRRNTQPAVTLQEDLICMLPARLRNAHNALFYDP